MGETKERTEYCHTAIPQRDRRQTRNASATRLIHTDTLRRWKSSCKPKSTYSGRYCRQEGVLADARSPRTHYAAPSNERPESILSLKFLFCVHRRAAAGNRVSARQASPARLLHTYACGHHATAGHRGIGIRHHGYAATPLNLYVCGRQAFNLARAQYARCRLACTRDYRDQTHAAEYLFRTAHIIIPQAVYPAQIRLIFSIELRSKNRCL